MTSLLLTWSESSTSYLWRHVKHSRLGTATERTWDLTETLLSVWTSAFKLHMRKVYWTVTFRDGTETWRIVWISHYASRFHDIRHLKIVRLSASRTGRLYHQKVFLVLIFTRGWVDPRAMVRSEGNMSLKHPVTPPGIDPGTVRLVAQRLG